jgi:hypothetical protein
MRSPSLAPPQVEITNEIAIRETATPVRRDFDVHGIPHIGKQFYAENDLRSVVSSGRCCRGEAHENERQTCFCIVASVCDRRASRVVSHFEL